MNVSCGCGPLSATPFPSVNQNQSAAFGTVKAADLYFRQQIQALISSRCAEEAREIGRLGYHWKLPVLNRIGSSLELFRRELLPAIVHFTDSSVVGMAMALMKLMEQMNQTQVRNKEAIYINLLIAKIILIGPKATDIERPPLWHSLSKCLETLDQGLQVHTLEVDESSRDSLASAQQQLHSPIKC